MDVPGERAGSRRGGWLLAAIVFVAFALRCANAWCASLHLDDFHTLYHARAADLGEFFARLRQDNHPPLSFLVVRSVRAVCGEVEFVLRMPAILFGTASVALVWRLARRLPSRAAQASAALLVALSSLNLELSADLRMYSLLTLALTGLLDAVLDVLEGETGAGRVVLWTAVGLHTHYHFVHALAVIAGSALLLAALQRALRPRLRPLLVALGLAGVLCLPWYAWGFPAQLAHGLAPGGSTVSPLRLVEGLVHLVYLNVRLGGALARSAFLAGGAVVLGLALHTSLRALRVTGQPRRATWLVLVAGAFALPAWSALASWITPRAGFEWRYIAGAVTPLALLAGQGAFAPGMGAGLRRGALGLALAAAFALSLLNVRDPGREDNRAAVRSIVARLEVGDAVVAAEWQPRLFPHSGAWSFYAPRYLPPGQAAPTLIDYQDDFTFLPGTELGAFRRVFVLARSIPDHMPFLQDLRREFPGETAEPYGMSIWLLTFERGEGEPGR